MSNKHDCCGNSTDSRPYSFVEPEDLPHEILPKGWDKLMKELQTAACGVHTAITMYEEAHERLFSMDVPDSVKALAHRGIKTANVCMERWSSINDDCYTINSDFKKAVEDGWLPYHQS